jgi:Predicted phage phi-C31 gp36 major capsid-like protein
MTELKASGAPEVKALPETVKEAFDEFMTAFEAFREANDDRLEEIEKKLTSDVVTRDKVERINRAMDEQSRLIDQLALKKLRPQLGRSAGTPTDAAEHKAAFEAYVRRGDEAGLGVDFSLDVFEDEHPLGALVFRQLLPFRPQQCMVDPRKQVFEVFPYADCRAFAIRNQCQEAIGPNGPRHEFHISVPQFSIIDALRLRHSLSSLLCQQRHSDKYFSYLAVSSRTPHQTGQNRRFRRRATIVSDIEFLEAVCERMQQVGLVQSKAEFSTRMLGKGPSYLTSMSARDRQVPEEVVAFLTGQLTADSEADDVAIFILTEQRNQRRRDQLHRNDLLGWIAHHRASPMDDTSKVFAESKSTVTASSIRQKLTGWLLRRHVVIP